MLIAVKESTIYIQYIHTLHAAFTNKTVVRYNYNHDLKQFIYQICTLQTQLEIYSTAVDSSAFVD